MMLLKSWLTCFLMAAFPIVNAQIDHVNPDSNDYEIAILEYRSSISSIGHLTVVANDSTFLDITPLFNIDKHKGNDNTREHQLVLAGLNYMYSKGYEMIGSLSYNTGEFFYVKEYIFKRKKKR